MWVVRNIYHILIFKKNLVKNQVNIEREDGIRKYIYHFIIY